jgi:hypothetical protein
VSIWLIAMLAIVAAVGGVLWLTITSERTTPTAPMLPGYFGPNEDVLEVDRELRAAMGDEHAHPDDDGIVL